MIHKLKKYFEYFYFKVYKRTKYGYSAKEEKALKTLEDLLIAKYGVVDDTLLWSYFIYQFSFWDGKEINNYNNSLNLNNVIGIRPFERFRDRNQSQDWRLNDLRFVNKYFLLHQDVREAQVPSTKHKYKDVEIALKLKDYNTPEGFLNCIDLTTLYNPVHDCCIDCNFATDCKALLKSTHPTIFLNRKIA